MKKKEKAACDYVMEAFLEEIRNPGSTGLEVEEPEKWSRAVIYRIPADEPEKLLDDKGYLSADASEFGEGQIDAENFVEKVCRVLDAKLTDDDKKELIEITQAARSRQDWNQPDMLDTVAAYCDYILPFIGGKTAEYFWTADYIKDEVEAMKKPRSIALKAAKVYNELKWFDSCLENWGPDEAYDFEHGDCHTLYELYEDLAHACGERLKYSKRKIYPVAVKSYEALIAENDPSQEEYQAILDEFKAAGIDVNSSENSDEFVKKARYVRCKVYNRLPDEHYGMEDYDEWKKRLRPEVLREQKMADAKPAKELMFACDSRRATAYFKESK